MHGHNLSSFTMTDNAEETSTHTNAPAPEEEPKPTTMAATDEQPPTDDATKVTEKMSTLSFKIWPPTQRTRDAVAKRLVETLSAPSSVLSKRYGTLPADEAADAARRIEAEAFAAAGASPDDDGIEVLQVYSKEISRRMLDAVKSRSGTAPVPDGNGAQAPDVAPASGEETKGDETEA